MIFSHPIYPITSDTENELEMLEQIEWFVEAGVSLLQIRSKKLTSNRFFEVVKSAHSITSGTNTKIIVNDRIDIAIASDADGVHVGQTDLNPNEVRRLLGKSKLIGFSTHNIEQFKEATGLPVDYIAVGPVFSTQSKMNADPVVGLELLKTCVQEEESIPIVAIGGIQNSNLKGVQKTGVAAVATISSTSKSQASIPSMLATWRSV